MEAPARRLREKSPARKPTAGETPAKRSRAPGPAGAWVDGGLRSALLARPPASPVPFAADSSDIGPIEAHTSMETDTSGSAAESVSPDGPRRRLAQAGSTPRRLFPDADSDEFAASARGHAHDGPHPPQSRGAELWSWSADADSAPAGAALVDRSADEESPSNASSIPLPDQTAFDTSLSRERRTPKKESPVCPPTPARTPAWAQPTLLAGVPLVRHNSLQTSKVLMDLGGSPIESDSIVFERDFADPSPIGQGSFSEVFKCRSLSDGGWYAVKRSKRRFRSRRERERFLQELEAFRKLGPGCGHVIRYFRAWQEAGHFYIQMELCPNGSIADIAESLPEASTIPERTLWSWLGQLARAVDCVHRAGFVHLDVKPQNAFVSDSGTVKLGDLGMAVPAGSSEDGWEGDNRYMAHELLQSSRRSTPADVFSLGICFYEIASGVSLPQDGTGWHDLRERTPPSLPYPYSQELHHVLCACMRSDPAKRPTAAELLAHPRVAAALDPIDTWVLTARPPPPQRSLMRCNSALSMGPDADAESGASGSAHTKGSSFEEESEEGPTCPHPLPTPLVRPAASGGGATATQGTSGIASRRAASTVITGHRRASLTASWGSIATTASRVQIREQGLDCPATDAASGAAGAGDGVQGAMALARPRKLDFGEEEEEEGSAYEDGESGSALLSRKCAHMHIAAGAPMEEEEEEEEEVKGQEQDESDDETSERHWRFRKAVGETRQKLLF